MHTKNLIFDLGGIFINLDYDLTKHAFRQLGARDFFDNFPEAYNKSLLRDFEVGKLSAKDFRREMREKFSLPHVSDAEIDGAWNAMLLDVMHERINLLSELKQHYRLFLFSNINEIHEHGVSALFKNDNDCKNFLGIFDRVYYSHHVGFRKPDRQSFERIILENNLSASDTLFIDDLADNLVGAKEARLNTHHLLPADCMRSALREHGYF